MRMLDFHSMKDTWRHQYFLCCSGSSSLWCRNSWIHWRLFSAFRVEAQLRELIRSLNRWFRDFFSLEWRLARPSEFSPQNRVYYKVFEEWLVGTNVPDPVHTTLLSPYPFGRLFPGLGVISSQWCAYQFSAELWSPPVISVSLQIASLPELWLGILAISISGFWSSVSLTREFRFHFGFSFPSPSRISQGWL